MYSLPLPPSLRSKKLWRRLSVTFAWPHRLTPSTKTIGKHFLWAELGKRSVVEEEAEGKKTKKSVVDERTAETLLLVEKAGLDEKTSQRGTIQHRVWEGEKAAVFSEEAQIEIRVSCKAEAGKLTESIPYALVVSLEVAEGANVQVYK